MVPNPYCFSKALLFLTVINWFKYYFLLYGYLADNKTWNIYKKKLRIKYKTEGLSNTATVFW